jgi:hypothetical protein
MPERKIGHMGTNGIWYMPETDDWRKVMWLVKSIEIRDGVATNNTLFVGSEEAARTYFRTAHEALGDESGSAMVTGVWGKRATVMIAHDRFLHDATIFYLETLES